MCAYRTAAATLHCAAMIRMCCVVALFLSLPALAQTPAPAPEPDARAEALNDRGKTLYSEKQDYAAAVAKFRAAIAISPDARYYYNLCAALEKLTRYDEALNACDEVFNHDPRPELGEKTGKRAAAIRQEMRASKPPAPVPSPPAPVPAPMPTPAPTPPSTTPSSPPEGEPVDAVVVDPEAPGYRWSLGADLGFVRNNSLGDRTFGKNGVAVQAHVAAIVAPRLRLGVEIYLHLSAFGERDDAGLSNTMTIADVGAALFWHKRLWRDLYFTPAGGLNLSFITVDTSSDTPTFGTLGVRLEAAVEWRFAGGRHVVRAAPISLSYSFPSGRVFGGDLPPEDFGLDQGGTTWAFIVGYTYRFERGPFPGLE
jgi:hypothetical protein